MKFLHISDLHFGKRLHEYSLIEDQQFWCDQLLLFLQENPHDAVIIAGDLYDRSVPSSDAVALLDDFLYALIHDVKIPVLAISGNHDSPTRLDFGQRLYRRGGLYMSAVPQQEIDIVTLTDEEGEVDFWLLPYISPADIRTLFPDCGATSFHLAYETILTHNLHRLDPTKRNVLVAHGAFTRLQKNDEEEIALLTSDSEINIGGADIVNAGMFEPFDYCAFGHYHTPQKVAGDKMRYSGSPLKYSISEEKHKKGVLSVTLNMDKSLSIEKNTLPVLHDLYSVHGTLEELSAPTMGLKVSDDYVFVDVLLTDAKRSITPQIKNLYPNYLKINYTSTTHEGMSTIGGETMKEKTITEIFTDFYKEVTTNDLSQNQHDVINQLIEEETRLKS